MQNNEQVARIHALQHWNDQLTVELKALKETVRLLAENNDKWEQFQVKIQDQNFQLFGKLNYITRILENRHPQKEFKEIIGNLEDLPKINSNPNNSKSMKK